MRITPLVLHCQRRIPALTALFSDSLNVTSITVVDGGTTTLNCGAAHGVTVGQSIPVSITDAETPNPIVGSFINADGTITFTTQYPHNLTTTPDITKAKPWDTSAKLSGFGSSALDGTKQLISVGTRTTFTVQPSTEIESLTLEGGEVLLERLEAQLVGQHKVTAATSTTLTLATPAAVSRSYTVTSPTVVRNLRCFGAASLEAVMRQYVRQDGTATPASAAHLFVIPVDVRASRSRHSQGDALAEIGDGTDYRQLILDGFQVIVVLPTEHSPGGVAALDLAHGEVFNAVLRTFLGLKVPRPELSHSGSYVATFQNHSMLGYDRANYYHGYTFQAPFYVANADAIAPYDWPDVDPENITDNLFPIGAPALQDVDTQLRIKPAAEPEPGELTVNVKVDEE